MKQITLKLMKPFSFFTAILLLCLAGLNKAAAQNFCNNEATFWSENFGTGTGSVSNPDVVNLVYQANGVMNTSGTYRVINYSDQNPNWHKSLDHTANDVDGRMVIIDAKAGDIYTKTQTNANGYPAGFYSFNFWAMNLMGLGNCGPNSLKPVLRTTAEYQDQGGNWVSLINSPATSNQIPETNNPVWVHLGGIFTLPPTGNFIVTNLRFTISDLTAGGCGNDIALDDIKFSACSDDGPVPVQFINVIAQQKGTGVSITWNVASEMNNKYFDVEKSTDAGSTWTVVSSVQSKGNTSIARGYTAYDAKPVAGMNYYRIRQVDLDGASKYSVTVSYNLKIVKTEISVLTNPFRDNITLDFLSTRNQVLNVRLVDVTGKQVISQQLNISKGISRKFLDANRMNNGIYILQVTDENAQVVYSGKLVKQ